MSTLPKPDRRNYRIRQTPVTAEDVVAYLAAVAAHPAFTARSQDDLSTPGLRIPLTADAPTFAAATALGRTVIWLHTFGERLADADQGRPAGPPRLPAAQRPRIPKDGAIPEAPAAMPDTITYDVTKKRLLIGTGYVENVEPAQADLLERICFGPTFPAEDLRAAGAFEIPAAHKRTNKQPDAPDLFGRRASPEIKSEAGLLQPR